MILPHKEAMSNLFSSMELFFEENISKIALYDINGFDVEFYFDKNGEFLRMKVVEI